MVSTQDTSDAEESGEDVSTVPIALPSLQYQVTLFLTSRSKSHQHKRTSLDSNRTYDCLMKRSTSSAKVYTRTLEEDDHSGEVDKDEEKCDEEVDEMTREEEEDDDDCWLNLLLCLLVSRRNALFISIC